MSADEEVQPQYDTIAQQAGAARLGMWLFLASQAVLFGGMFVAYFAVRTLYPQMVADAATTLDKIQGLALTFVLILSSFTMAVAVRSAKLGERSRCAQLLVYTAVCPLLFLAVTLVQYVTSNDAGLLPGALYTAHHQGEAIQGLPHIFFGLYFGMTGLHAVHVLVGLFLLVWARVRLVKGHVSSRYYAPVENVGLYWQFVVLAWIFIFPVLFLVE